MSGHSKWAQIKHKKALTDAKKGKVFSKISRMITIAARQKGPDLQMNPQLRLAVEKAKKANMPSDNIERAIKRASGDAKAGALEEVLYEAYGPEGSALVITGITDNKNRASGETKHILSQNGAKLAEPGSVVWMFKKRAVIELDLRDMKASIEALELALIDAGAENIKTEDGIMTIIAPPEKGDGMKTAAEKFSPKEASASLDWIPENTVKLTPENKKKVEKLAEALLDNDDIQDVFSNAG